MLKDFDKTDIQIARDILFTFFRDTKIFGSFSEEVLNALRSSGYTDKQAKQLRKYFVQTGELNLSTTDPSKVFTQKEINQPQPISAGSNQRCSDLAESIRETLALIKQYEKQRRLSSDPKGKRHAEQEIADLRQQLSAYEADSRELGCD